MTAFGIPHFVFHLHHLEHASASEVVFLVTSTGLAALGAAAAAGASPWYEWCVTDAAAFVIPLWADLLAIGIGALQGAMFAAQFRDRRLDLLGVAIIGIATGFGGGLIRDVLLAEIPAALSDNWYLLVATGAALLGMLLERVFSRLRHLITALDALTIGLFGAIGTTKALAAGLPVVPSVFVGALSAVGGSILRDLLLQLPIALMHVGSLYAVAAIAGCTTLVGDGRARRSGVPGRERVRRDHVRRAHPRGAVPLVAAGAARDHEGAEVQATVTLAAAVRTRTMER